MKFKFILPFLFAIVLCNVSLSQPPPVPDPDPGVCYTPQPGSNITPLAIPPCNSFSELVNYIPDCNITPVITFKINIHIFRRSNGTGVFQPSDIPFFLMIRRPPRSTLFHIGLPTLP